MSSKVNTILPVGSLLDLKQEWKVVAFRKNGEGDWHWSIDPSEIRTFRDMIDAGNIISVHRRDSDGTRMLAKVKGRGK